MTENQNPSGSQDQSPVDSGMEKKDMVAFETYQKTLQEAKSAKATKNELVKQNEELMNRLKSIEESEMQKQGEWQKMAELRAEEARKATERANMLEKDMNDTWKLQAFFDKLPGKLRSNEYLTHVDLESIAIDPETRAIEESSVEQVVSSFMEKHASLVEMRKSGGLPSDAPRPATKKSFNEMSAAERSVLTLDAIKATMKR